LRTARENGYDARVIRLPQREECSMMYVLRMSLLCLTMLALLVLPVHRALADNSAKVDAVTRQVETGARHIGQGVEETARGIGNTVVEGAKLTSEKVQEAGKTVEPQARTAWNKVKDGANSFAAGVKDFFNKAFGN
jgi:hypothetical protein